MSAIELFHEWGSIQSFKVRLCLAELGLEWESRRVDLSRFDNLQPGYLAVNPQGLVPTLWWRGAAIDESSVINELLNELAGSPLLPGDPIERARARCWAQIEDRVVHPAVRPPTFNLILKARVAKLDRRFLEETMARHPVRERATAYIAAATAPVDRIAIIASIIGFRTIIADMERALTGSEWLAAETFSLADVAMAAFVDRLDRLAMECLFASFPHARHWAQRIRERPSFATAQGPENLRPDPLVDAALVAELIDAALAHTSNDRHESR
ncbi:glutathione S-transferase family protein [Mesorhizobium sp. ANAO-SY3R2]|uniref:glutathione S-transferase family protein n=1 Tax=Mesorhizobium sp. ANAO-SY3R2 TaxID=3166644 RepID=UPI003672BB11